MRIREAGDLPNGGATAFKLIEDCFSDADWKLLKRKGVVKLQEESLIQKTEETKMLLNLDAPKRNCGGRRKKCVIPHETSAPTVVDSGERLTRHQWTGRMLITPNAI